MVNTMDKSQGLESYIKEQLSKKEILLMTHIVMGYPSFEASYEIVKQMVESGVDLMELQIPFSEPMADGPVILKANQKALEKGSTVAKCLEFAQRVAKDFPIPFLFMDITRIGFLSSPHLEHTITERAPRFSIAFFEPLAFILNS